MQEITIKINETRGSCRIVNPIYLGGSATILFEPQGTYSVVFTEPFADSPHNGIAVWAQSQGDTIDFNRKILHDAFKTAGARQPNSTLQAKVYVLDINGKTIADGEATIEYSPSSYVIDTAIYPTINEVLMIANTAKSEAKGYAEEAQAEKEKAQEAQRQAGNAAKSSIDTLALTEDACNKSEQFAKNAAVQASAAAQSRDEARGYAEKAATHLATGEGLIKANVSEEKERAQKAESDLSIRIETIVGADKDKSARTIAAEEVAKVVANAPADLDTLKEIAGYIESDKTGAAQMAVQIDANAKAIDAEVKRAQDAEAALGKAIAKKVDAEEGKGLSTNDYTPEEKEKLSKAYTPDNPPPTPDLSGFAKKSDIPYALIEEPLADSINLQDRAITQVIVDYPLSGITFTFPEKTEGRARDFFLRLVITDEIPTLYFKEPNGENVSFDADDDSWAAIEQGVNILMFSDTGV